MNDIQAAAMNGFDGFDYLVKVVKLLTEEKEFITLLEYGKRYLKRRYQRDGGTNSNLSTHNQHFALIEEHNVDEQVSSCVYKLFLAMNSIIEMAEKNGDEDKIYDVKNSIEDIISYIKHQIRDSQQSEAKSSTFEHLDANTALWLKDYVQKVLPDKHRSKGLFIARKG